MLYDTFMIKINIQKVMDEKGLSVKDIVPYMNISERTIYRILRGKRCPTIVELEYFSRVLEVEITDLFSINKEKKDEKTVE